MFKATFTLEIPFIMTIIYTIWKQKNIFYVSINLKIRKNQYFITISIACNLLCKGQTFLQVNEFFKNLGWKHGAVDQKQHMQSPHKNSFFSIPLLSLSQFQHLHYTHFWKIITFSKMDQSP